jgi:hypothetical protein
MYRVGGGVGIQSIPALPLHPPHTQPTTGAAQRPPPLPHRIDMLCCAVLCCRTEKLTRRVLHYVPLHKLAPALGK